MTSVISDRAESVLRGKIGSGPDSFELKPESIGPLSQYLGGKLSLITLADGTKAWSFSSGQYVRESCKNVKRYLSTAVLILMCVRRVWRDLHT